MNAEELMVGDWVFNTRIKANVKVVAMDSERQLQDIIGSVRVLCDDDSFGTWTQYLEPIPLTAEILEKNGFKVGHYLVGLTEFPEYKMVNRNEFKNVEKNVITIRQSSDMLFDMQVGIGSHIFDITYVHELQHALKLCGIEKDIEL